MRTTLRRERSSPLLLVVFFVAAHPAVCALTQQAALMPSENQQNDAFGAATAIQQNIAIVGCPSENSLTGAAYVFVRSGDTWSQQAKLLASDAATYANFGISVALYGNPAIVGAYGWGGYGANIGAAYVFVRSGSAWTQQAEFTGPIVPMGGTGFGVSVALGENAAVVGAWGNSTTVPGEAYVFSRTGTTWSQ